MKQLKAGAIGLLAVLTLVFIISFLLYWRDISYYLTGDFSELSDNRREYKGWLIAHFVFTAFTLFLGPIQFIPWVRKKIYPFS